MRTPTNSYKRHRFHSQFISHVVWLYARFSLSLREVEELLLERGVDVSYESIRRWTVRFGVKIARKLRRRQSRPGDGWYLNEVAVKIAGSKLASGGLSINMVSFCKKFFSPSKTSRRQSAF